MRYSGGLPTGTTVYYWWVISDAMGQYLTTMPQMVNFSDMRFDWQSLQRDKITLYWYNGNNSFAQKLLDTAIKGLVSLEAGTGAGLSRPVSIYVYNDSNDMLDAMLFAQDWTGGAAYPSYGTIIIGINNSNLAWGERAMVHELAHIVNYQMTNNPYNVLPVWLNEGLATYAEGTLEPSFQSVLISALTNDKLFNVRSIASPFSTDGDKARLAYAQSYSLVDFLISEYGSIKMADLLNTFRQGSTYDGALLATFGFDMDGLYQAWVSFAMQKYLSFSSVAAK